MWSGMISPAKQSQSKLATSPLSFGKEQPAREQVRASAAATAGSWDHSQQ
jgi:hypothetical protein